MAESSCFIRLTLFPGDAWLVRPDVIIEVEDSSDKDGAWVMVERGVGMKRLKVVESVDTIERKLKSCSTG